MEDKLQGCQWGGVQQWCSTLGQVVSTSFIDISSCTNGDSHDRCGFIAGVALKPNDGSDVYLSELSTQQISQVDHTPTELFPIGRLSAEILAEVFVHCIDEESISHDIRNFPLLLCTICSSWRDLTLRTPKLWSTLNVTPHRVPSKFNGKQFAEYLYNWLKRSGDLPLTLILNYLKDPWKGSHREALFHATLTVYGAFAPRWQKIKIDGRDVHVESMRHCFVRSPSAEKTITISLHRQSHFQLSPNLFGHPSVLFLVNSNISWHLLTHVNICVGYSLHPALEIIQFCPNMTSYSVKFIDINSVAPAKSENGPPILNKNMRHFHLTFGFYCRFFFNRVTLPSLEDFSVNNEYREKCVGDPLVLELEILSLFTRSRCKLRILNLQYLGFNPNMLIRHESCETL
ncbi:hypothetical protein AMATHDRAFT_51251 [Amanita thiersii Skay4041]|uniref:F-box domain-containing protein n=1 Tax=Amanita thiersii Skay4041 TaxID=703135 RepID=A0A2A9ND36_9AGAR|nr:hypothetical protein AMATHDRAFT_51251 [Amanita thiersii Skay4041]